MEDQKYNITFEAEIGGKVSDRTAEAWAVGTRNGVPVSESDPTHNNSSKDWALKSKEYAESIAGDTESAEAARKGAEDAQREAEKAQEAAEDAANSLKSAGAEATTLGPWDDATAIIQDINGAKKFLFGIPRGEPFVVKKTFASIAEMNAYTGTDVKENDFVMIVSDVEDEDNAKLYFKTASAYVFITDLSGAQGFKGDTGLTPVIQVGTVTTLAPGSNATITLRGTTENPIFDFGIPRGDKGETGAVPSFTVGTVETLPEGSQASASVTGTDEHPVLNLGIPKGDTGSMDNVSASNIPMSPTDSTTIKEKFEETDFGFYVKNGRLCQKTSE